MQVDDVCRAHAVVQRSLDRRTAVLGDACGRKVVLDLLLALRGVAAVLLLSHLVEKGPVEHRESFLANGGESVSAGLDP